MFTALALVLTPAFASPLAGICAEPSEGMAYMVDGATLDWAGKSYTCDGDRMCEFTLPGDTKAFKSSGESQITFQCGGLASVRLICTRGACGVENVTATDPAGQQEPYFEQPAAVADASAR